MQKSGPSATDDFMFLRCAKTILRALSVVRRTQNLSRQCLPIPLGRKSVSECIPKLKNESPGPARAWAFAPRLRVEPIITSIVGTKNHKA